MGMHTAHVLVIAKALHEVLRISEWHALLFLLYALKYNQLYHYSFLRCFYDM